MSDRRSPTGVVEMLRLLSVVFFAGVGFEVARGVGGRDDVLGPFNGVAIGVIVGSGIGYVLGGIFGRTTVSAVDRAETRLRDVSAEALVAGAIGLVCGVLVAAGIGWPLFLIPDPYISFSVFATLLVVLGYVGLQVGRAKQDAMLGMFGARAGLRPADAGISTLPRIVDSSVAIDGRILDVVRAGFLHGTMLVCTPVLGELQGLADAGDDVRRARGRRGLDTLEALKREPGVTLEVCEDDPSTIPEVDAKLVRVCLDRGAALLTLDTNLAKAAGLAGVRVLNMHQLTLALRPAVSAGDEIGVLLIKNGKEPGQAVGYLDDGTMVVAEKSRAQVGSEARVRVTSVLTTANGRMVFAQPSDQPAVRRDRR